MSVYVGNHPEMSYIFILRLLLADIKERLPDNLMKKREAPRKYEKQRNFTLGQTNRGSIVVSLWLSASGLLTKYKEFVRRKLAGR